MSGAENYSRCSSFEEELGRVDEQREKFLLKKIRGFLGRIKPSDKVLIACHPDADGFVSGALLKAFLDRFFGGKVQTEFCTDTLETQEFYEKAKNFRHVITGDLWIDEAEEKQEGLRALLEQGVNIAIFDHHDKEFQNLDPSTIEEMMVNGMNYNPLIPETLNQGFHPRKRGNIIYVSPKRLGFKDPDSNKFTGGLVIYKTLGQSVDLSDLEFLLPISAKGDGDAGRKFWLKLVEKYQEHDGRIMEIAGILNLGKNLTISTAERLMMWLLSMSGNANPFKEIEGSKELLDLKKLRDHIRGKLEKILGEGNTIGRRFFHYHVKPEDEKEAREGLDGNLNPELELDVGVANELCGRIGNEITILVTQARKGRNGHPQWIHVSARDERNGDEYDASALARNWGGGGHKNAAGATIRIPDGWVEDVVIAQFRGELERIADSC